MIAIIHVLLEINAQLFVELTMQKQKKHQKQQKRQKIFTKHSKESQNNHQILREA